MAKSKLTLTCPRCNRLHEGITLTPGTLGTVCLICVGPTPQKRKSTRRRQPATTPVADDKD